MASHASSSGGAPGPDGSWAPNAPKAAVEDGASKEKTGQQTGAQKSSTPPPYNPPGIIPPPVQDGNVKRGQNVWRDRRRARNVPPGSAARAMKDELARANAQRAGQNDAAHDAAKAAEDARKDREKQKKDEKDAEDAKARAERSTLMYRGLPSIEKKRGPTYRVGEQAVVFDAAGKPNESDFPTLFVYFCNLLIIVPTTTSLAFSVNVMRMLLGWFFGLIAMCMSHVIFVRRLSAWMLKASQLIAGECTTQRFALKWRAGLSLRKPKAFLMFLALNWVTSGFVAWFTTPILALLLRLLLAWNGIPLWLTSFLSLPGLRMLISWSLFVGLYALSFEIVPRRIWRAREMIEVGPVEQRASCMRSSDLVVSRTTLQHFEVCGYNQSGLIVWEEKNEHLVVSPCHVTDLRLKFLRGLPQKQELREDARRIFGINLPAQLTVAGKLFTAPDVLEASVEYMLDRELFAEKRLFD